MTRISDANLDDCVKICRDDLGVLAFNCKSFTYNAATQHCFLSDENSLSLVQKIATTPSETLYELFCVEGAKPENNEKAGVAYLYGRENRYYEEEVPFQRYRNSILQAEFSQTIREVELSRCLDECLHASPKCMSIVYSARSRECKLSTFNQRDSRILYDPFFDYYENIIDQAAGPGGPLPNRNPNLGISSPIDKSNRKLFGSVFLPPEVPALPPLSSVVNPFSPEVNPLGPFRPLSPTSILFPGGPQDNIGYYDRYPGAFRPSPPSPGRYPPITGPPIRYPSGGRTSRCDPGTGDSFRQVRSRTRLRQQFIRRLATVNSLFECEQECLRERIFKCLSFNYIVGFSPTTEENCELSEKNSYDYDIDNPVAFEQSERFDYYQREAKQEFTDDSCLDVSQTCDQDGMAFTLKTPEGFRGRIYTHNNYGRSGCYVRGTGGNLHTLRIPGSGGFPDCGTGQYGDTITNIVVVQFSEDIQTNMDMKYNLTCTTRGPGSAVVTSGYIGAGSGQPVPIEYLPAEHTLDSRVRLVIKYQDRPTTTIAVGDPLQFKLETQEGENLLRDIFATNVIAKDPYSDRIVELIDSRGCPIDPYVFPALGLSRAADGLETSFNAFKIPESNFLVFEATVRSCRSGCRPAVCDGPSDFAGRDNSFGRRRRESDSTGDKKQEETDKGSKMEIREMFRVYETRSSIPENGQVEVIRAKEATVCLVSSSYKGMLVGLIVLGLLLTLVSTLTLILYRRSRKSKSVHDMSDPGTVLSSQQMSKLRHLKESKIVPQERYLPPWKHTPGEAEDVRWQDPSEPIYTDPSLFEKM
ncbi:uncharacterized protein LOC111714044 isoform X2 [Eurytemora carolleeae]|uniref:uncharacterized protein LOC111714044 isoform X2 n=1 Tax=Eurytemora carolleeae TaxID=1294199 RepID=UPI000C75E10F|nr:uncharacterized protein LOC111714044 isoform X2 [Eurytemora carolleeae]|eukprot:XP_023344815.1 uncharacterized protein LOC111714044 isoform X2 [Eurytemora affinis]